MSNDVVTKEKNLPAQYDSTDMDNDAWAAEVTEMEAAFEALARRGLVVACGQRFGEHSGCVHVVYKLAPGVTPQNFFALAFDAYDTLDAYEALDTPLMLPPGSA
jgi:hypothetical protein